MGANPAKCSCISMSMPDETYILLLVNRILVSINNVLMAFVQWLHLGSRCHLQRVQKLELLWAFVIFIFAPFCRQIVLHNRICERRWSNVPHAKTEASSGRARSILCSRDLSRFEFPSRERHEMVFLIIQACFPVFRMKLVAFSFRISNLILNLCGATS